MALIISSYLQRRNGTFYFRRTIPKDLRPLAGQSEFVFSLRTDSRQIATTRAIICLHATNTALREMMMTDRKRLDPQYKERVRKALASFRVGSHESSEEIFYQGLLVPQDTLEQLLDATRLFLESGQTKLSPALHDSLIAPLLEAVPELSNFEDSDPELAVGYLSREFIKSLRAVMLDAKAIHRGEAVELPTTHSPAATPLSLSTEPVISSLTTLDAWAEYVAEKGAGWQPSTKKSYQTAIAEFTSSDFIGNPSVGTLTREDLISYRSKLQKLPAQRNKLKPYRDKSISELIAMDIPEMDLMMGRTINERLGLISSFLTWCHSTKNYLPKDITHDILLKKVESAARAPFTDDEIKQLFNIDRYKSALIDSPYKFWVPLFGLLTGARISEIAQLQVADITLQDGIPVIQIVHKTKTKAGRRIVPVHSLLLQAGLVDYVDRLIKQNEKSLFPEMRVAFNKPGDAASKWFTRYRREAGIPDTDKLGKEKVFHSFRHSFVTRLRQSSPAPDISLIQQIVGHERELFGATAIYTDEFPVSQCKTTIEQLRYPIDTQAMRQIWPTLMKQ